MKQALMISGRVELSRHEITLAIKDWLARTYNLLVTKSVYVVEKETVQMAVVEVKQATTDASIPNFTVATKQDRDGAEGYRKANMGIFNFLREYLEDEKKKKNKTIELKDLLKVVKDFYPKMDDKRLHMYLYDRRQLPNIKYKDRTISL